MRYSYVPESAAADQRAAADSAPPPAKYTVLRPAQPYDLATPGTPRGIRDVARAADAGAHLPPPGGWRYTAALALACETVSGVVVASLALRLTGDLPGRPRRAYVVYSRRDGAGWEPAGAALLDVAAGRALRPVGIEQLKATLRGEVWTPPPPSVVHSVPCPTCGQPARLTNAGVIYASHRCDTKHAEGRS